MKVLNRFRSFFSEMDAVKADFEEPKGKETLVFRSPSELRAYEPPPGSVLVGDFHISKGEISVLAGAPGLGKSRAAVALSIAGATGKPWFGLPVHTRFKTVIIQNENGPFRLKREFDAIGLSEVDDYIRVSPPPEGTLDFFNPDFARSVKKIIAEFSPDLIVIDPWTSTVGDDKSKDYRATIDQIKRVIGNSDTSPAILIIAHTRKPKTGDKRAKGRSVLNEIAGSFVLGASARSVFSLMPASENPEDDRVIFENPKNNNGEMVVRTVWHRRDGLFEACNDFDWKSYDSESGSSRATVSESDLKELFSLFNGQMLKKDAVERLQTATSCSRSVAYEALKPNGKFGHLFEAIGKDLRWLP